MEFYRQKMWFKYRDQVVSSLYSHRKPITTHDFSSAELKTQLTFLHLSRTYVSRFAGKVDTHLCECTMKEYIYFFNIEAGDWTWNCTRLCFVESIGFFWTELAAIVMNDFLTFHKLQCSRPLWSLSWPTTAAVTTWLHLQSCLMYAPTAVDGMSVVALNLEAGLVADFWSQMVWVRLRHWHYRTVCACICWKKLPWN